LTDDVAQKAIDLFDGPYNCAQAVFKAVLEHKDIKSHRATDIAAAFGGGIVYTAQQCGAVSGALMALGILAGEKITDVREHKGETYRLSKEFHKRFKQEFGTIICDGLVNVNMADDAAKKKAIDEGHFAEICPKFVGFSAATVLDLVS
jgi:C_GCAxxG_C_C family probable redox protein